MQEVTPGIGNRKEIEKYLRTRLGSSSEAIGEGSGPFGMRSELC